MKEDERLVRLIQTVQNRSYPLVDSHLFLSVHLSKATATANFPMKIFHEFSKFQVSSHSAAVCLLGRVLATEMATATSQELADQRFEKDQTES